MSDLRTVTLTREEWISLMMAIDHRRDFAWERATNPGGGWDRELWRNEQKLAESAYQKLLDAKVEVKS